MSLRTSLTEEARHWPEQEPLTNHQGMIETMTRGVSQLGFWSALIVLLGGIVYLVSIVWNSDGGFPYPPVPMTKTLAGITVLLMAPALIVLMSCIHAYAPRNKKVVSQIGFTFLVAFAVLALINRFLQFTVLVQQSDGLALFDLYNLHSVALALEMLSWGFFLGLAVLCVAPVFTRGKFEHWIRGLLITAGVLCIASGIGYVLANQLGAANQLFSALEMGFGVLAWAVILPLATALLAVLFKRLERWAV